MPTRAYSTPVSPAADKAVPTRSSGGEDRLVQADQKERHAQHGEDQPAPPVHVWCTGGSKRVRRASHDQVLPDR
jgi:hypothetical protein